MIEVRQLVQLVGGEQPEVEKRGWEHGVHFASSETDERGQRKSHLIYFGGELWVARALYGRHDGFLGAGCLNRGQGKNDSIYNVLL